MYGGFSSFGKKVDGKKVSYIDNATFRLHYRVTFTILAVCSLLTTSYQYFGAAIQCMGQGVPGGLLNTYCWIQGTFTVPGQLTGRVGKDFPHPGVGPSDDPQLVEVTDDGDEIRHAWYQWVALTLAAQALLFYLPHYIWKSAEGGRIGLMVQGMDEKTLMEPEGKEDKRRAAVQYFIRTLGSHNSYVAKYVACEVLNFINVLFQIYFMDMFLNGQFTQYGLEVLRTNEMLPLEERVDPLAKVFPKLSKCTFNDYGPSGTVQRKDALCLLAVNIINEKIYIFLWFWFFTLAVWTGIHMLLRIVTIASVNFRKHQAFKRSKGNAKTDTSMVVENCNFGDFFILMQLAKHLHPGIFREFIIDLRQELTLKNRPSLLIGCTNMFG